MTYQADTNSKFNKKLLQIYILLNDEKEITYESFNEYEELDSTMYYRLMQEYQEMLNCKRENKRCRLWNTLSC